MSTYEADAYLKGMTKRSHAGWEQVRALMRLVYSGFGGKGELDMEFPWDEESEKEEGPSEEELDSLRKEAERMQMMFNNKDLKI